MFFVPRNSDRIHIELISNSCRTQEVEFMSSSSWTNIEFNDKDNDNDNDNDDDDDNDNDNNNDNDDDDNDNDNDNDIAWAFATVDESDALLFALLAREA